MSDLLVDFEDGADLFDLIGLSLYLEEALHQKVDVVPKRPRCGGNFAIVLREVSPYERQADPFLLRRGPRVGLADDHRTASHYPALKLRTC